jgi:AAA domain
MGLFKPAEISTAKLKMALMGFQGSGKTYTATGVAIGLVQMMQKLGLPEGSKPIAFGDTEKGSRWVMPQVQKAGLQMVVAKTRAFSDLLTLVDEAEASASVLLVDSLTHFWTELCDTYSQKKAAQYKLQSYRLQFQDWAFLKAEWRKFTDRFVNSNVHVVICGRAGYEYNMGEDEETGKKQLEKTGIKFKAEGEMGYEPDLLVLMERVMDVRTKTDQHIAHVVKDRSTLLDGKEIADPTFESFLPHINMLNLVAGKMHLDVGVDTSRTSAALVPTSDTPRDRTSIQRNIVIDEINDLLLRHDASGTSAADKKKRSDLLQKHFGTVSKTAIEEAMSLFDLRAGYEGLHQELEGKASRYSQPAPVVPGEFKRLEVVTPRQEALPLPVNDDLYSYVEVPINVLAAG